MRIRQTELTSEIRWRLICSLLCTKCGTLWFICSAVAYSPKIQIICFSYFFFKWNLFLYLLVGVFYETATVQSVNLCKLTLYFCSINWYFVDYCLKIAFYSWALTRTLQLDDCDLSQTFPALEAQGRPHAAPAAELQDFGEIFMRTPTLPQHLEGGPERESETNNNYFKGSAG